MQLIRVGTNVFNLEAVTHANYEENNVIDRLVNDDGTVQDPNEPGCTLSFGTDDILIFYGDEAQHVWRLIAHKAVELVTQTKGNEDFEE